MWSPANNKTREIRSSTRGTHSVGAQVRTFDGVEAPVRELSLLLLITARHEEDGLSRKHRHDDQDLLCAPEFLKNGIEKHVNFPILREKKRDLTSDMISVLESSGSKGSAAMLRPVASSEWLAKRVTLCAGRGKSLVANGVAYQSGK